jgi:hypothetical protein
MRSALPPPLKQNAIGHQHTDHQHTDHQHTDHQHAHNVVGNVGNVGYLFSTARRFSKTYTV